MRYYFRALKKYGVFRGRASRKEYWMFFLFSSLIIPIILGFIEALINDNNFILVTIYQLAVVIPTMAVSVRRMHDVNMNGWFLLFPIFNLILVCTPGTKGDNRYGPEPSLENEKNKFTPVLKEKSEVTFCYKCGEALDQDSKFCSKCGAKVIHPSKE